MVRCSNCSYSVNSNRTKDKMCWQKWGLCGVCAVKFHPEQYPKMRFRNLAHLRRKIIPARRIPLCPDCNGRIIQFVYYKSISYGHYRVPLGRYCPKCGIIFINGKVKQAQTDTGKRIILTVKTP